jgi:hypothetical protein
MNLAEGPSNGSELESAGRHILKATLVPLKIDTSQQGSTTAGVRLRSADRALPKFAYIRQLGLQPGEVHAVRSLLNEAPAEGSAGGRAEGTSLRSSLVGSLAGDKEFWDTMQAFEGQTLPSLLPPPSSFATVPIETLRTFGSHLHRLRQEAVNAFARAPNTEQSTTGSVVEGFTRLLGPVVPEALTALAGIVAAPGDARITSTELGTRIYALQLVTAANRGFEINTSNADWVGMLNLERLEMNPAGIQRGELIATIPLAPLEKTAVSHKEWSVTSKEFTSIVQDSLENVSETGVTDNTELSQSTTSQIQHSNQFNITATVSGGIPLISGSSSTAFTAQGSDSKSATDSIRHATSITKKASARTKQEHKITITTKTETGSAETSTRIIRNPSETAPARLDYFSMMRKWRVGLYRYGLRLTYDITIPAPGSAMRNDYKHLAMLRDQQHPFVPDFSMEDITNEVIPPDTIPRYQVLANQKKVVVPLFPGPITVPTSNRSGLGSWSFMDLSFDVLDGYEIADVLIDTQIGKGSHNSNVDVLGTAFTFGNVSDPIIARNIPLFTFGSTSMPIDNGFVKVGAPGQPYLKGATGHQTVTAFFDGPDQGWIRLTVHTVPTEAKIAQWRADVWNALYNAAHNFYLDAQQIIAGDISQIEDKLANVDTLTLRREESDEVMKSVLRFLLGPNFEFMPKSVSDALAHAGAADDATYGVAFTGNTLNLNPGELSLLRQYEEMVRFINQAIEWENVVTFLYSYFWDVPIGWEFIRKIRYNDLTRQAFLRAGSARVVLTIRKGWEEAWTAFFHGGAIGAVLEDSPYLSIAREIGAYDDRNYPGIPPANPARTGVRLEDAVATMSSAVVSASSSPVVLSVDSSAGFVVGDTVVIDSDNPPTRIQEAQQIVEIPSASEIRVAKLDHDHGQGGRFLVTRPGDKGVLIAEWNEYTPSSGVDIALTSNLATIA